LIEAKLAKFTTISPNCFQKNVNLNFLFKNHLKQDKMFGNVLKLSVGGQINFYYKINLL